MLLETGLTDAATNQRLNPITTCECPFRLRHVTGATISGNAIAFAAIIAHTSSTGTAANSPAGVGVANTNGDEGATGFKMNYRQLPGNC